MPRPVALRPDRLCTIDEVARAHGISANHLTKVVQQAARLLPVAVKQAVPYVEGDEVAEFIREKQRAVIESQQCQTEQENPRRKTGLSAGETVEVFLI